MPWKFLLIYDIVYQVNPLALEKLEFTLQYIYFKQVLSQVITCLNFNINLKEKYALKTINFFSPIENCIQFYLQANFGILKSEPVTD